MQCIIGDEKAMSKTIVYDGHRFTKPNGRKYYRNTELGDLHRYVWKKYHGDIPKGYDIHHKDRNTDNNDISNLMMLSVHDHHKLHSELLTKDERLARAINVQKNAEPEAIKWHKSKKGREWHKKHYELTRNAMHMKKEFVCVECGKRFIAEDTGQNKFCSNKCKSRWRRDNHLDDVIRTCVVCGKKFKTNKYKHTECCSKSCAAKLRWIKRRMNS